MKKRIIIAGVIGIFAILLFVIVSDNKTFKGGQIAEYQKENFAEAEEYSEKEIDKIADKVIKEYQQDSFFENSTLKKISFDTVENNGKLLVFRIEIERTLDKKAKVETDYFLARKKWYGWEIVRDDCC